MGNCFTTNKTVYSNEATKDIGNVTVSEESDGLNTKMKKKKKVESFRSGKRGESKNGVVRIRLVVTQEELKQIIMSSGKDLKQPSMEQMMRVLKLRGVRVSEEDGRRTRDGEFHGGWRPALESIPEELYQYMQLGTVV
ncbi:hypothetical protein HRI_005009900 [Hibiscus trionum]|uniref:Uncharacterized protein n=1 Tax=Hibiscus trionum TaxID=183268 RepID=A0A9W7MU83_HIBTR|nr:hypothetical protein HRI_005009900 [Hibiscus trionum]